MRLASSRSLGLAATLLASTFLSGAARAQDAPPASGPGTGANDQAATGGGQREDDEIIVTAQ